MNDWKSEIIEYYTGQIQHAYPEVTTEMLRFEYPREASFGELAVPCFPLAKLLRQAPLAIAEHLAATLPLHDGVAEITAVSGYLNIGLQGTYLVERLGQTVQTDSPGQKVTIEFSSPNTNKPLHIGHLRNIVLGESLAALFQHQGNIVVKTEVVNDRGIAIAKMMLIYDRYHTGEEPQGKPDHFAGMLYVEFEQRLQDNPELEQEAQEILRLWEDGDSHWYGVWKLLRDWVVQGQHQTYDRLPTSFDERLYESDIYKEGKDIVIDGYERGILKKHPEHGYIYADLESEGMPNKILLRSNGTALYITQDLALLQRRLAGESLCVDSDKLIYITAHEQNLQFAQLFAIVKQLGIKDDGLHHVGYGAIRRPEGKMSSRKGNVLHADTLIDDIESLVREQYFQDSELSPEEQERRIQVIARASYWYYLLGTSAKRDMVFDEKASVSLTGKTGPYILYAYARIQSILHKSDLKPEASAEYDYEAERALLTATLKFPEMAALATSELDPAIIAQYIYELAELTNSYYHKYPVIGQETQVEQSRLYVLDQVSQCIRHGLSLLTIETLPEM